MPRTYGRLQGIKLKGDWNKTIDQKLNTIVRNAAREYVRALIVHVPVWTGMARGSIKFARGPGGFLAAFLNVAIPITPHPKARVTGSKNEAAGGRLGRYNFTSSRHIYRFTFKSDVPHYIVNEFFARPPGVQQQVEAPWHSQEYAIRAFKASIDKQLQNLPKVKSYFVPYNVIPFAR